MWVLFSSLGELQTFTRDEKYTTTDWDVVADSTFNPTTQDIEKNVATGVITIENKPTKTQNNPPPPQPNFNTTLPQPQTISTTAPSQSVPIGTPIVIEKTGLYSVDGIVGVQGTYGEIMEIGLGKQSPTETEFTQIPATKRSFLNYAGGSDTTALLPLNVGDSLTMILTPLTIGTKNINMATLKAIGL